MGSPYDFKIDTLEFRAAVKDDTPYARSTAPFRKDQVDTAQVVGDQSLTGWWTRGQLSFHEGAGIKYYDILGGGQDVLNTFQSSTNVETMIPGGATLNQKAHLKFTAANEIADCASFGSGVLVADIYHGVSAVEYDGTITTYANSPYNYMTLSAGPGAIFACSPHGDSDLLGSIKSYKLNYQAIPSEGVTLYQHTTSLSGCWYAKGRLWAIDSDNSVYALDPDPSGTLPLDLGTPVATLPSHTNTIGSQLFASFTSSPGDVYITNGSSTIYRIGLSSDGSVPTLTAPIVAAELPNQEFIQAIGYFIGFLVIVTSRGVRVAEVQSDGSLVYGPLFLKFKGLNTGNRVSFNETFAYVSGDGPNYPDEDPNALPIYKINLAQPSTSNPLVFAWAEWQPWRNQYISQRRGVVLVQREGAPWFWQANELYQCDPDRLALDDRIYCEFTDDSAVLTTGFHRMGTLDPKQFVSVSVRVGGDGGWVDVYTVSEDGSTSYLGGCAPQSGSVNFPILAGEASESLALRFSLRRGTATSQAPILHGYQLKALPVPKRQRLLKWPLQLTDTWRDRYGQGHGRQGRAWEDLQALEALESSKAIVPFEDYRTGETGTAYIDSIEFQSDTPSTPTSNGFGGIAYVQLRVIS